MGQWQSNYLKQLEFATRSDGKMSNAFHLEAGSKIQLFVRQAGCFQETYRAAAQAIPPLGAEMILYCSKERIPMAQLMRKETIMQGIETICLCCSLLSSTTVI